MDVTDESADDFDQAAWERRWSRALATGADAVAHRPANRHLVAVADGLAPGRALDAGAGHGAETLWLAARGWRVDAVDFSTTAIAHGRSEATRRGDDVASRVSWTVADLTEWSPTGGHYDLVTCLYVHSAGPVETMVRRLAAGVAAGGTLLMVGHRPTDPATGAPTAAVDQVQISVESVVTTLDPADWDIAVAEERRRPIAESGVDAVVVARRFR